MKKLYTLLLILGLASNNLQAQWMQWECRSNNSLTEFETFVNSMKDRGYAPVNFSFVTHYNDPRISSVWQKANINDWACGFGMLQDDFIEKIKYFNQRGLTPVDIAVWQENNNVVKYAAIWQRIQYEGIVEIGINENELSQKLVDYSRRGYSIRDLNGYAGANGIFYTCIFDKRPGGTLIIAYGRNEAEFQKEFDKNTPLGYYPIDVSYFNDNGLIKCNGIWAKTNNPWDSRKGYSLEKFQDYLDKKTNEGYIPIDIDQYYLNGEFYYGATLVKNNTVNNTTTPKFYPSNITTTGNKQVKLSILPVEQQTDVWCWLATGEMIFKHYNLPNLNPRGNYQCAIIGSIFSNSPCYTNCFNTSCIRGSGSNANTVRMLKDYSWIASKKIFTCKEAYELNFESIKNNIDRQKPILCGISPNRRQYYSGAEHVVVLTGYETFNNYPYVIINDPFNYALHDNPYTKSGATVLQKNQYRIGLKEFTNNFFWHWSLSDIEIK